MMRKFADRLVWFRRRLFFRASRETMTILIPFLIIGTFSIVIANSFLTPSGFGASILHIGDFVDNFKVINRVLNLITSWTTGLLALFASFKNAEVTARLKHNETRFVGLAGMITYIILVCLPTGVLPLKMPIDSSPLAAIRGPLSIQGLLLGLIVGYLVAQIFSYYEEHGKVGGNVEYKFLWPISISFLMAIIFGGFLLWLNNIGVFSALSTGIRSYSSQKDGLMLTIVGSIMTGILNWIGLSGPFDYSDATQSSVLASQNAIYALQHNSIWKVPYPFSQLALYHSYATYGGVGATLALMIAIVIMTRNKKDLLTVRWGLFPALFNSNSILMLGLPIFFNVVYLVPFVLVPVINMLVAAALITMHIIPPVPFPVPNGTPGPLIAFVGTSGNFSALIAGVLILAMDVFIYLPFVKFNNHVNNIYRLTHGKEE